MLIDPNLNAPSNGSNNLNTNNSSTPTNNSSPSSPTNSDGSGDTIRPGDTPKDIVYKAFYSSRKK